MDMCLRLKYMLKDRAVKHKAIGDRRVWREQMETEVEKSAERTRTRELYQAARKITNKKQ